MSATFHHEWVVKFNDIPTILGRLSTEPQRIVNDAVDTIAQRARTRAPVDTGFLRDSIESRHSTAHNEAEVVAQAFYAIHVEYGTVHTPAQPFIRPAVEEVASHLTDKFEVIFRV